MKRSRPSFEQVARISKGAQERGSSVLERERALFDALQEEIENREVEDVRGIDKAIMELSDAVIDEFMAARHPELELREIGEVRVVDQVKMQEGASGGLLLHGETKVGRREESKYGHARVMMSVMHEKCHEQSFTDLQITRDSRVARVGFETKTTDSDGNIKKYFSGINEALTKSLEQRLFDGLPQDNFLVQAVESRGEYAKDAIVDPFLVEAVEENPVAVSVFLEDDDVNIKVFSSYAHDLKFLNDISERVAVSMPGQFSDSDEVIKMLEKTYLTGEFGDFKNVVNKVFGPKGLLVLSRWENADLYSQEVRDAFSDFIAGELVDEDKLISDLEMKACNICRKRSSGSICESCNERLPHSTVEESELVCRFCGDPMVCLFF